MRIFLIGCINPTAQWLAQRSEIEVVGSAEQQAPDWNQNPECDLVLVDAALAHTVLAKIHRSSETHAPKLVVMDAEETKETLLPFFEAGAAGYIPKGASPKETIRALDDIQAGRPDMPPHIASALVARMRELALQQADAMPDGDAPPQIHATLTQREQEILELIGNGLSNQEIAAQLTIELGTVKNHVHKILKKLGVSSRVRAAQFQPLAFNEMEHRANGVNRYGDAQ